MHTNRFLPVAEWSVRDVRSIARKIDRFLSKPM